MVKLLKYEMKKQQTSRMVIGSILLVCVLGFALGMLLGREKLAAVSLAVMMLATFFVVFYVGIESILVLNRDLKTKQSYMLWMVPKSIWEILGSKFLAAILQMLIVFVMYVAVGLICILVTLQHTGHLSDLFKMIWQAGELYIDGLPSIIWGFAEIFLGWTVVIMAGFVGVILSRTLLLNAKYSGFLAVVVFFAIIIAVEKIYDLIPEILESAIKMVSGCPCEDGCPACVGDYNLDKKTVLWGLDNLLEESEPPVYLKKNIKEPQPVIRKEFSFFNLPDEWEKVCYAVVKNGEAGGQFLKTIKKVSTEGHKLILTMENEFYAKWLMEPDNLQSLTNTLRYHVICPADMQIRVRYEAKMDEQEKKERQKKRDRLQRRYDEQLGNE